MRAAKLKGAYNSLIAHTFFECETSQKDIMAWDLLVWSNLALYPSFQVGNTCSALVHCLYGGYNLHRFSDALGLVISGGKQVHLGMVPLVAGLVTDLLKGDHFSE